MKKNSKAGLLIHGFLLLGMGVGFLIGNIPAGTLIGLVIGFIGMFLMQKSHNNYNCHPFCCAHED